MTENVDLDFAVRQRVMHRTSRVDALVYQYGLSRGDAEARYDADTAQLIETGELPDLPPSPDISGSTETHQAESTAEQAADAVEEGTFREPSDDPELDFSEEAPSTESKEE